MGWSLALTHNRNVFFIPSFYLTLITTSHSIMSSHQHHPYTSPSTAFTYNLCTSYPLRRDRLEASPLPNRPKLNIVRTHISGSRPPHGLCVTVNLLNTPLFTTFCFAFHVHQFPHVSSVSHPPNFLSFRGRARLHWWRARSERTCSAYLWPIILHIPPPLYTLTDRLWFIPSNPPPLQ